MLNFIDNIILEKILYIKIYSQNNLTIAYKKNYKDILLVDEISRYSILYNLLN